MVEKCIVVVVVVFVEVILVLFHMIKHSLVIVPVTSGRKVFSQETSLEVSKSSTVKESAF